METITLTMEEQKRVELMSLSGMVEIPRLQAKQKFVMPAKAGIQVGARDE